MDLIELYFERLAIMSIDGGMPFDTARFTAYQELRRLYGRDAIPRQVHEMATNKDDERWKNWKRD